MDSCDNNIYEQVKFYGHGNGTNGFRELLGITITELGPNGGVGEMPLGPQHLNPNGTIHGGALYSLADTVTGHVAIANGCVLLGKTPRDLACTTVSGSLNFLRQARGSKLTCVVTCRKMGKTLAVMDVSILDDQGTETSAGSFTYYYLDRARFLQKG